MALVTNQRKLYGFALKNHFILPAFNFYDLESMRAIFEAAEELDSPIIAQVSQLAYGNLSPIDKFLPFAKAVANEFHVPIMLHHDYLSDFETCKYAIDIGFQSVSFDGSRLPYQKNIYITQQIVEYAHIHGTLVEAELGNVPGDGFAAESAYTDPYQAAVFVRKTGCDALAISAGTSHGGLRTSEPLEIQYQLLNQIRAAVGDIPLILHGAASRPSSITDHVNRYGGKVEYLSMASEEDISKTRYYGVAKIYADMDNWLSITGALRQFYIEQPEIFNPTQYMPVTGRSMKEAVKHKISCVAKSEGFGSAFYKIENNN
jgi:fructose-bisphosphate aldolase class II